MYTEMVAGTSQITGSGAIIAAELEFTRLHRERPAFMVPSATYGMYAMLATLGIGVGDEVIVPTLDWPASLAAVLARGAVPVFAAVDETLTLSAQAVGNCLTARTKAVIACHLHGVAADVLAIRDVLAKAGSDIPIIEDCAQALGSTLDEFPVGTLGDAAIFSFGPGKTISTGEGGMVVMRNWQVYEQLLCIAAHPVRQIVAGLTTSNLLGLSIRPHPMAAVLLREALSGFDPESLRRKNLECAAELDGISGIKVLGADSRRQNASSMVPVTVSAGSDEGRLLARVGAIASKMMDVSLLVDSGMNAVAGNVATAEPKCWLVPVANVSVN
jgi:dTDP-4-amino-4,6-dideoxygalactose transaminase